jgi:hypothetical protein
MVAADLYSSSFTDGGVNISPDSGITWVRHSFDSFDPARSIPTTAISANGQKVLAGVALGFHGPNPGPFYASSDGGDTWRRLDAPTDTWVSIACSADGQKVVAAIYGGALNVSSDSGATWTKSDFAQHIWSKVASSSDGNHLVAVASSTTANSNADFTDADGAVYRSLDGGRTWFAASAPQAVWTSVAVSKDGTRIAAASKHIGIWLSGPVAEAPMRISLTPEGVTLSSEVSFAISVLLQSTNLESGLWSVINRDPSSSGDPHSTVIVAAANRQFFRLIQP